MCLNTTRLMRGMLFMASLLLVACGGGGTAPTAPVVGPDPLYSDQWNLKNTGQAGADGVHGVSGEDLDVEPVWANYKGNGVHIAVVDDGLEIRHEDLAANVAAGLSYNYLNFSSDPTNDPTDSASGHGTAVAGIVAARDMNGLGG